MKRIRRSSLLIVGLLISLWLWSATPVKALTITVDGLNTGGEWDSVVASGTVTGSFNEFKYTHNGNVLFLRFQRSGYVNGQTINIALDTVPGGTTGGSYGAGADYRIEISGAPPGSIAAFSCPTNLCNSAITPSVLQVAIGSNVAPLPDRFVEVAINFAAIGITTPGHSDPFTMRAYVVGGSSYTTQFNNLALPAPTDVDLISFGAAAAGDTVTLTWATAAERNIVGFNVLRSATEQLTEASVLNESIIVGTPGSISGGEYSFIDTAPLAGASYWLQVVNNDGTTYEYGPVRAVTTTASLSHVFLPLVRR